MKRTLLIAAMFSACASLSVAQADAVKLTNLNDSVNYALGILNGNQLKGMVDATATNDDMKAAANEFGNAMQRGWDGQIVELSEAQHMGQVIGQMLKKAETKGLADIENWTANEALFFQGMLRGINQDTAMMTVDRATEYMNAQFAATQNAADEQGKKKAKVVKAKCVDKVKKVKLKTVTDSINFAFGYLNGNEMCTMVIRKDSADIDRKAIIEQINKALASTDRYPELVATGEQIGLALQKQSANGFMGEKSLTTDFELVRQGMIDGLTGTAEWNIADAQRYMERTMSAIHFAGMKAEGEAFLKANGQREGVITTASGLQYEVLREGTGLLPMSPAARVKVHYEGSLIDGTVFDSSYRRGEPIVFGLNQVIKGWTEGVMLMQEGAKHRLYIPYYLGYGERGAGQQIPPYATLIFDVELLEIQ